jgi:RNA polymerase primary sigma factor
MARSGTAAVGLRESENHLANYVRAVKEHAPMDRDEEIALAREIHKGSTPALERMVLAHLHLAVKIARNYQRCGISLLDLINEGNIGLMRAARKFNPDFGIRFTSYASWWIKQRIAIFLIQHGRGAISVPIRKVVLFKAISKESQILQSRLHRKPTIAELSERLKVAPAILEDTIANIPEYVSMDDYQQGHLSASGGQGAERMSDVEARMEKNTFHRDLEGILESLSEREKQGVLLFYGLTEGREMSYADVGRRLRISREGARQLIRRSLNKIRLSPKVALLREYL